MTNLARRAPTTIARPLKTLVPQIQHELRAGDEAGLEHYRRAGEMLLEAREQVAAHKWAPWLSKNFALSKTTAWRYMRLVTHGDDEATTIEAALGYDTARHARQTAQQRIRDVTSRLDTEELGQRRQSRDDERDLHRQLALDLIDAGYRALAPKLHPDIAGSNRAMARLNRVRDELRHVAKTRRFD